VVSDIFFYKLRILLEGDVSVSVGIECIEDEGEVICEWFEFNEVAGIDD
jgi:hypothetical protein